MKRIIIWDKDEILLDDEDDKDLDIDEDEDDDELDSDEAEITNANGQTIRVKMPKSQQVIHTNFGPFLAHHPDNPYNSRDVWIANTNFDLAADDINAICRVPGVEALAIISRYSFTIIIGVVFYPDDVLNEVDASLGIEKILTDNTQKKVSANQELIDGTIITIKAKFWYAYIMPNGETVIEEYETVEAMDERKPFFIAMNHISEGLMISSDERPQD